MDDALHAQWDAMMNEMEMFYNDHQSKMKPIQRMEQGKLYAGFADSIWYRVQLIDYGDIKDTVIFNLNCFFIPFSTHLKT